MVNVRIWVREKRAWCLRHCECPCYEYCLVALLHLPFVTMMSDECIVPVRVKGWGYCLAAALQSLFVATPVNPDGHGVLTSLKATVPGYM